MGMNDTGSLQAWRELGHGSPEREREIEDAVIEMVTLAHLGIDAVCRHLPDQEVTIRRVIRHVLTDPACLGGGVCGDDVGLSTN